MQALILAGGQGTRLRPLTRTTPKPVLPLAGRPFLTFMLDWLVRHGVEEAILSCGFLGDHVEGELGDRYGDLALRYVTEPEPLGTAGPVRLALEQVGLRERLLVLNGDILTDFDLSAEIDFHARAEARATLALAAVEDARSYGLVTTAPDGAVEAFLEKEQGPGDEAPRGPAKRVNAGAYVLERDVVERIPAGRAVSFEREVFPSLIGNGLFGHPIEGYWVDIGTPARYLEATRDLLTGVVWSALPPRDVGGSLVGATSAIDGAEIGPLTVVGEGCRVEPAARVSRSVLFSDVVVGAGASLEGAIVGEGAAVGRGARIEAGAVVGGGARVEDEAVVPEGARVDPGGVVDAATTAAPAGP